MTDTTSAPATATGRAAGETITVVAWRDPVVEAMPDATLTATNDTLVFQLPVLGPTATLIAHRLAGYAALGEPRQFTMGDLARTFGLANSTARVQASLRRLEDFDVVKINGDVVAIRLALPPLAAHRRRQLPGYLAEEYRRRQLSFRRRA